MHCTVSCEIHNAYFIYNKLLDIKNVVQLPKVSLSGLNAKFPDLQDPPSLYALEHQEFQRTSVQVRKQPPRCKQRKNRMKEFRGTAKTKGGAKKDKK